MAIVSPPALTARQHRAQFAPSVAIAMNQIVVNDNIIDQTTANSLNCRTVFYAPKRSAISDIVVTLPSSYWPASAAETDWPVSYTATAAIEYPAGTFTPLYAGASRTLSVTPGRKPGRFDPCPIDIPAGAQFWVKIFCQWTAGHWPLITRRGAYVTSEWMNAGTGVADNTLTTTVFTNSNGSNGGFGCMGVYGRLRRPSPVVGLLGDSITAATSDNDDPTTGARFMEKALQGQIPVLANPRGSDGFGASWYGGRHECRDAFMRSQDNGQLAITDMVLSMGRNDMGAGSLSGLQSIYLPNIERFLTWGLRVWMVTVTPKSTSSDGWITAVNQTADTTEALRQQWNNYLRASYKAIGVQGIFDWAHAIDPTDSGKWGVDAGVPDTRTGAQGFGTLSGRALNSIVVGGYNGNTSGGTGYPISSTIPASVDRFSGDLGISDAVVNATISASGSVVYPGGFAVVSGGDYDYPPLITVPGRYTADGTHPTARGYAVMQNKAGLSPGLFVL